MAGILAGEQEGDGILVLRLHVEHAVFGEAVLGHMVGLIVQDVLVVPERAGHGEEQRGLTAPPGGIALPEPLGSAGGLNAGHLRAQRFDGHGQSIISDGYDGVFVCHAENLRKYHF